MMRVSIIVRVPLLAIVSFLMIVLAAVGVGSAAQAEVIMSDSFTLNSTDREVGDVLRGTAVEFSTSVTAETWSGTAAGPRFATGGHITADGSRSEFASVALPDFTPTAGQDTVRFTAKVKPEGTNWIYVGLYDAASNTAKLWDANQLGVRLDVDGAWSLTAGHRTTFNQDIARNRGNFTVDAFNDVRMEYNLTANTVSLWLNGTQVVTNLGVFTRDDDGNELPFTPAIEAVGIHFLPPRGATNFGSGSGVDDVKVELVSGPRKAHEPAQMNNRIANGTFDVADIGWWWWLPDLNSQVGVGTEAGNNGFLAIHSAMQRGRPVEVFSSWFKARQPERTVKLSFKARGQGDGAVGLGFVSPSSSLYVYGSARTFHLSPQWQQFQFELPLEAAQGRFYQAVFSPQSRMDLDEVEIGTAAEIDGFQTATTLEAGLSCAEPTWIFYTDETPRFTLHSSCIQAGQSPAELRFKYQLTDYNDQPAGTGEFTVPGGALNRQEFDIAVTRPGYYRINWALGDTVRGQDAFVVTTAPPAQPDPRFAITMSDSNYRQRARQIRRLGAGGIRLHGFFQYHHMEGRELDTTLLEHLRGETGASLMAMLTGAPPRLLDKNGRFNVQAALEALDDVADQTAPYMETYEIYNEPNGAFPGTAEDYARYLAAAYARLKSAHPDKVVAGICPSNILLSYIEQVLKAGAAGKMDVLSFHPYGLTSPDVRGINRELRALQDLVAKYSPEGALPKLWATEIGYRSSDRPMNKPQRYPGIKLFSEAEVARFMVKMNLMLLDGGVERMYWFHLPGVGGLPNPYYYGFAYENPEHAVPKKQVAAFCQMTRALAGISMQGRVNAGDDELYLYRFAGGTASDLKERWVLFRNERSNERHVSFIRSETPLVCQAVDGVPQPAAGRIGDVSIIEAGLAPGYVFNPSDRPGEILVPVSVEDVPEQMLDDSQIHLNVMCRNIFDRPMTVWVRPQLPQGWQSDLGQLSVPLSAGESRAVPLSIAVPASGGGAGSTPELRFEVQMPEIMEEPYILTRQTRLQLRRYVGLKSRTIGAASLQWTPASPGKNWTVKNDGGVVRTSYVFDDTHNIRQVWGAVRAPFEQPQDLGGYRQIKLEMKFSDPSEFMLSIMLTDPSGALYRAVADVDVAVRDQWQTVTVNLDEFRTIGSSGVQDDNGKLDLDRIRGIGLLGNSHRSATGTFEVRSITLEP